ncbi:MAG: GTP-binding protein [Candidatus Freyarchaeota archaeon]|nr:GTP-binding protein [Candidatus Jordarchaeia archaeon]MBS7269708.1 GTP-binding protein [Candidatus Jordarchaeia archaeon]MBS7280230.1 GTP-binding protein [Candidatus Jordarchaeia archaeon]
MAEEPRVVKILVTGPYSSGKSTVVSKLCKDAVSIDALQTTVGFDFGSRYEEVNFLDLKIFGTPGQERFKFLQEILAKGSAGILLVVDSTSPENVDLAKNILVRIRKELPKKVPVVILANKQDLVGALSPEEVRKKMGVSRNVPVIGTVAPESVGLKEAITTLIKLMLKAEKQ